MKLLTTDEVIALHDMEVPDAPVINWNNLDSAVSAIGQSFSGVDVHPTIHDKAAALLRGVAHAHGFQDGNKRAAVIATVVLYALNGWELNAPELEFMHLAIDALVEPLPIEKIASYLEQWATPLDDVGEVDQ